VFDAQTLEHKRTILYDYQGTDSLHYKLVDGYTTNNNELRLVGWVEKRYNATVANDFTLPWVVFTDSTLCIPGNCTQRFTGIEPVKASYDQFDIFPNPFSDFVNIQSEDINDFQSIDVLSTSGQRVYSTHHIANTIDLSHLSSGMYIMVLTMQDGHSEYRKIIKQ